MFYIRWIFYFAFIFFYFSTCHKTSNDELKLKQGGTITIALQSPIENLFPYTIREYDAQEISRNLLSPALTNVKTDDEPYEGLAYSWKINKKNTHIVYFLNPKLTWSNGQPVSTKDVKASYEFLKLYHDQVSTLYKTDLIEQVIVYDSLQIEFRFNQPVADPVFLTRFPILKADQLNSVVNMQMAIDTYFNDFIGCGPFVLSHMDSETIHLDKNPESIDQLPFLDRIDFKLYSNVDSLIVAMKTGRIDFVYDIPHTKIREVKNLPGFEIKPSTERGFTFLGWNLRNKNISDLNVRKGLTYAIDRRTIVDGIMSGYADVQDAPSYIGFWAHLQVKPIEYNLGLAQDYMAQAGWFIDQSTRKLTKNGQPLNITILTNIESEIRVKLAANIKAYWEALGAQVNVNSSPWPKFLKELKSGNFDVALISWVASDGFDPSELFHSSGIASDNNFMNYINDTTDSYIETALTHPDKEIRKQNWISFQKQIIKDMPITVLFNKHLINVVSKKIRNVEINSRGYLYNAKEWWLDDRK